MTNHTIITFFWLILFTAIPASTSLAQESSTENSNETLQPSKLEIPPTDSSSYLDKQLDDYLKSLNLKRGANYKNGKLIFIAAATSQVKSDRSNPGWVQSRNMAFEQARTDCRIDFASFQRTRIKGEIVTRLFEDSGAEIGALKSKEPATPEQRLALKTQLLKEAELEQKLKEMGVSESEIHKLNSPTSKRKALEHSISIKSVTEAVASTTGLITLQTFEGVPEGSSADDYGVGIVCVYTPKQKQLAIEIVRNSQRATPDFGENIEDLIAAYVPGGTPETDSELCREFGVRVVRDSEGSPLLIAYGQAGVGLKGTESRNVRTTRVRTAREHAYQDAVQSLAAFVNSTTSFLSKSNQSQDFSVTVSEYPGGLSEETELLSLISVLDKGSNTNFQADFSGLEPIRKWSAYHPITRHHIVGTVLVWSPRGNLLANAIRSGRDQVEPNQNPKDKGDKGVIGSKPVPIDW